MDKKLVFLGLLVIISSSKMELRIGSNNIEIQDRCAYENIEIRNRCAYANIEIQVGALLQILKKS